MGRPASGERSAARRVVGWPDGEPRDDVVAREEPLEIRLNGEPWVVTMRTPGHDIELVHGFLHAEGVVTARDDVVTARYCAGATLGPAGDDVVPTRNPNTYNVIDVALVPGRAHPAARTTPVTSACGLCGSQSIDAVRVRGSHDVAADPVTVEAGHYDVSVAVAENELLPALRAAGPGAIVLADGFSCRKQVSDLTLLQAMTLAELLAAHRPAAHTTRSTRL